MMDLHQTFYQFYESLIVITGVIKGHLGENVNDYHLRDYYHLRA